MKEYKFEEKFYWDVLYNYVKYLEVHVYKERDCFYVIYSNKFSI